MNGNTFHLGSITSGDATHEGSFISHDGDGESLTEKVTDLTVDVVLNKDALSDGSYGATIATASAIGVYGTLPNLSYTMINLGSNYLRLDCSNDPLTGDLQISSGGLTLGDATTEGALISHDGDGESLTEKVTDLAANVVLNKDALGDGTYGSTIATAGLIGVYGTLPNLAYTIITPGSTYLKLDASNSPLTGNLIITTGGLNLGVSATTGATLRLYGAGSGYSELVAPAIAGSGVFTLPNTTGTLAKTNQATDTFGALTDNTTNDVTTSLHGFAPKAPNDTTKFLRGDATWAVPLDNIEGGINPITITNLGEGRFGFYSPHYAGTITSFRVRIDTYTAPVTADVKTYKLYINGSSVSSFTSSSTATGWIASGTISQAYSAGDAIWVTAQVTTVNGVLDTLTASGFRCAN